MSSANLKKQMSKNVVMNMVSFATKVLIGLWIIPYLVKHIGVVAYGLVPLAMLFSEYIGLIVQSLNSAINRYLLIALQKENYVEANKIFNTSLVVILSFVAVQSLIMLVILLNLSLIINIPEGLASDVFYLFTFTYIGFSISLIRGVIATPIFAHNRLDLLRVVDILQVTLRASLIVILFTVDTPQLQYVGIANLFAAVILFFIALYFNRKLAPQLKLNFKMIDFSKMRELSTLGGWVIVNQIGSILFLKIDLFVANKFLGVAEAGNYAIVLQWNSLLRSVAAMLSGVLSPVVMIFYAKNELSKMVGMLKNAFKLMAILIAMMVGIVTALAGDLLVIWLGEDFRYLENILIASLIPLVINLAVLPLFPVNIAYNKVKIPGLVTLFLGIVNLILAITLVLYTQLGIYAIILAGAIVLTSKNALFLPLYSANILGLPKFIFMKYHLLGIVFYMVSFLITKFISSFSVIDSFWIFLIVGIESFVVICLTIGIYIFFDKDLKKVIRSLLIKKVKVKK